MKKPYLIAIIALILVALVTGSIFVYKKYQKNKISSQVNNQSSTSNSQSNTNSSNSQTTPAAQPQTTDSLASPTANLDYPIAQFSSRITKKPFGIYITPSTSPVQPERFTGYHTGTDIEYQDIVADVPAFAITAATVKFVGTVSGYGGVIILQADINGQSDTILYGHVRASSINIKVGDKVSRGQQLAVLGTGYSSQTDGERRHLHFSIHRGSQIEYRGYVQNKADLSGWLNPQTLY